MECINISNGLFNNLEQVVLPSEVHNTEGSMHLLKVETYSGFEEKMLKRFSIIKGPVFGNKLITLNSLISLREKAEICEFVYPEKLITIDGIVSGYIMRYIKSTNFKSLLINVDILPKRKIELLKQVGTILRKMEAIRKSGVIGDFYLNDLQEENFILDREDARLKVIDLDSIKIDGNRPFLSKYLSPISPIKEFPTKYRVSKEECTGSFIPDKNTDLYCYIMMILNTILNFDAYRLTKEQYFNYMDFLIKTGVSKELVDILAKIYSLRDNEYPDEYLDELIPYFDDLSIEKCKSIIR